MGDEVVEGLRGADIDARLQILVEMLGGAALDLDRHVGLAGDLLQIDPPRGGPPSPVSL
jgi:hypothetical protein